MTNGNGLILNRNGAKPRGPETHNVTKAECEAMIAAAETAKAAEINEFYVTQIPGLVAKMTLEILKAHGIEPQAPPPKTVIDGAPGEIQ